MHKKGKTIALEKSETILWWFPGSFAQRGKSIAIEHSQNIFWWFPGSFAQKGKTIALDNSHKKISMISRFFCTKSQDYSLGK